MQHKPVLLAEVLRELAIKNNGNYVDCTFGRGGHSQGILSLLGAAGRLVALDRDNDAIESSIAKELLEDSRFALRHCGFSALDRVVAEAGLTGAIDGILMDLGVSSPQLDDPLRGFSFMQNGPLDMRMDASSQMTAAKWLALTEEKEIADVLFEYGEERFARRIARAIVIARGIKPISTTFELVKIIEEAIPRRDKHKHPATRSFQAIRIAVNQELNELKTALDLSLKVLKTGGRLVVISFHSLEDRIVKQFIRNESGAKYDPGRLPVKEADISKGLLVKKGKPIIAGAFEIEQNPRARSAIMRVAERV
ncbi:MAG: 16S rRNA (cytosine(1402)-N(4))-methyltransferase RsmH [Methylococcaceae bacterium]|nr:16S rRNA (cytosine(1402)-N(4))-methyltransferase RsmH [Methylococcaceae bacterium]